MHVTSADLLSEGFSLNYQSPPSTTASKRHMQQQEERFVIVVVAVLDSTHFKSKQEDGNLNRSLVSLKKEEKKRSLKQS